MIMIILFHHDEARRDQSEQDVALDCRLWHVSTRFLELLFLPCLAILPGPSLRSRHDHSSLILHGLLLYFVSVIHLHRELHVQEQHAQPKAVLSVLSFDGLRYARCTVLSCNRPRL